ncbi:MAG TPA: M56 family metallopeptidase [Saprospiraceae bacterium]|nr:M56 family metallopeptidase [Saprospiraceae bacterium]
MMNSITYLVELTSFWVLALGFYHVIIRNSDQFVVSRYFLISTLLLGLVFPYITALFYWHQAVYTQPLYTTGTVLEISANFSPSMEPEFDWAVVLLAVYLIGVILALYRFFNSLFQIRKYYRNGENVKLHGENVCLTRINHLPFSFWNTIFIGKNMNEISGIDIIIRHEAIHVHQRHSLDILIVSLVKIVFWFHPLVYLFEKYIKANHEFIADHAVCTETTVDHYKSILMQNLIPTYYLNISNHFFSKQLNFRLMKLKNNASQGKFKYSYFGVVPFILLLLFWFSKDNVKTKPPQIDLDASFVSCFNSSNPLDEIINLWSNYSKMEGSNQTDFLNRASFHNIYLVFDGNKITEICRYFDHFQPTKDELGDDDENPRFPGCEHMKTLSERQQCSNKKLIEYMAKHLKYPEEAKKNGIEGTNIVQFVVDIDGSLKDITLLTDIGYGTGDSTRDVFENMNVERIHWIPGKKDGKVAAVKLTMPVQFKLQEGKKEHKHPHNH